MPSARFPRPGASLFAVGASYTSIHSTSATNLTASSFSCEATTLKTTSEKPPTFRISSRSGACVETYGWIPLQTSFGSLTLSKWLPKKTPHGQMTNTVENRQRRRATNRLQKSENENVGAGRSERLSRRPNCQLGGLLPNTYAVWKSIDLVLFSQHGRRS